MTPFSTALKRPKRDGISEDGVQPTTGDDMENVSVNKDGKTLAPAKGTTD